VAIQRGGYVSTQEPSSDLLVNWKAGNPPALTALVPLVYDELRTLARRYLRKQRPQHTLQSTALVHEAYLRLKKQKNLYFDHPNQFFALAALVMRQVLVDYARSRQAAKRDAGWRLSLDDCTSLLRGKSVELIALDDALKDLARLDAQQSRIVELRFFGGLSIEETAEVLGVSPATVKRHWASARIWLFRELSKVSPQ
jgi:RNA polymerase sigma factor (TIGR02999 family)